MAGTAETRNRKPETRNQKPEHGSGPACPLCLEREKRDRVVAQASAQVVDVLKKWKLTEGEAYSVLGIAGSYYSMERNTV